MKHILLDALRLSRSSPLTSVEMTAHDARSDLVALTQRALMEASAARACSLVPDDLVARLPLPGHAGRSAMRDFPLSLMLSVVDDFGRETARARTRPRESARQHCKRRKCCDGGRGRAEKCLERAGCI